VTYKGDDFAPASPHKYMGDLQIPSTVMYYTVLYNVTSIGDSAFHSCDSLTSVIIGDSIKTIGNNAFLNCSSLDSITIPLYVTIIQSNAFTGCTSLSVLNFNAINCSNMTSPFNGCLSLKTVNVGNRVKVIPSDAFSYTKIETVNMGDSVTTIVANAFMSCYFLSSINLPNSLISIGAFAFYNCSGLTSINIPNSVSYMGNSAFGGCSALTSIILPNSLTVIHRSMFAHCSNITKIVLGDSVTSIREFAFSNCSNLDTIILPNTLDSLGAGAFMRCFNLSSINLPYNVTSILNNTFSSCTGLTAITCKNNVPPVITYGGLDAFFLVPRNIPVYVPCGSVEIYQSNQDWNFSNFIPSSFCIYASDTNITLTSVTLNANCADTNITEKGFKWRKVGDSFFNSHIDTSSIFQHNISNLLPGTEYEYKAYCVSNNEMFYSLIDTFATEKCVFVSHSNLTSTTATLNAISTVSNFTAKGFQCRQLGTTAFNNYIDTSSLFQYTITNLLPFTKYECRAYIEINNELSFSSIDTFLTLCSDSVISLPFYEGFEGNLTCWVNFRNSNDNVVFVNSGEYPTCAPHEGTKMLMYRSYFIQADNYAGYISPKINILPNSKLSLWIYRTNGQFSSSNEGVRVLVNSIQSEHNAIEVGFVSNNKLDAPVAYSDGWHNYIVNIPSSEIGEKFVILKAESQYGYNIYFDDLSIYTTPTITTNINASICQGDAYTLNGFNADSAGTYIRNLNTIVGGDSIVVLTLNVIETPIPTNLVLDNIANYFELRWTGNSERYIIYRNDILIVNLIDTFYKDVNVVEGTNYCYKVKSITGNCESEFSQEACQVFLGLNSFIKPDLSISLFPNPTNEKAVLEIEGLTKDVDIILYDINGRKQNQYSYKKGQKSLTIDVSALAKGIYNLRMSNENININRKLIVQ